MAERPLGVQAVHLSDLAVAVLPEQSAERDVNRNTLREQRQALASELGVHPRLRGDRAPRRDPGDKTADAGPRRGDGDAECARIPVTRRDREGMEIHHLFKLYHGVPKNPADYGSPQQPASGFEVSSGPTRRSNRRDDLYRAGLRVSW
jgi:hypothetical protein